MSCVDYKILDLKLPFNAPITYKGSKISNRITTLKPKPSLWVLVNCKNSSSYQAKNLNTFSFSDLEQSQNPNTFNWKSPWTIGFD